MIDILPESESDALAIVITGELTSEDYAKLEPELELRADRPDDFDVLVEISGVEGLEPGAIRDDLRFATEYSSHIGRMAVVTDEPLWQGVADLIGKPLGALVGAEVERFDDRVEAWKWLRAS